MNNLKLPTTIALEWLEADGLGGFASGTSNGVRTRRYHALLLHSVTPPTGRIALVNGFDACVRTATGKYSLSSQYYAPGVVGGDGASNIEVFSWEPWPHWIFKLEDGTRIELEIFSVKGRPITCLSWKLLGPKRDAVLSVRPFLSGRDYHSLHKSNPGFCFDPEVKPDRVSWQPYPGIPGITALINGDYSHEPQWYYNFLYEEERARGLDCEEDLAAPGVFSWNLGEGQAVMLLTTREHAAAELSASAKPVELLNRFREDELARRERFPSALHRVADSYVVEGRHGKTIVAGYPWFTDWGRDTFIALRGICLAGDRLDDAGEVLSSWAGAVSEGMLPNLFPDMGEKPEFNSVDASLWYVIAVNEYLEARSAGRSQEGGPSRGNPRPSKPDSSEREKLLTAVESILEGYSKGTRFGIRLDSDGLLSAGERGVQLTWMDAKVGEWVVTPRAGKPVEVQALWLNALKIAAQFSPRWKKLFEQGLRSFRQKFWNQAGGYLFDIVDVNHRPNETDAAFRPNQILAAGGLPFTLLEPEQAARVVAAVEERLWTPLGLRSLAPGEPGYAPRYAGGVRERDGAYHQGTVWPWLIGPFVQAWVQSRGGTNAAKREARGRFLAPILAHLEEAGLGHVSEIADAEKPHAPRGCPFQAWSVGEILRLENAVLAEVPGSADSRGKPVLRLEQKRTPSEPRNCAFRQSLEIAKAGA